MSDTPMLSVFPLFSAPEIKKVLEGSGLEEYNSHLKSITGNLNKYKATIETLDYSDYRQLASFFRFYNNPFYVQTIAHDNIDEEIFDDFYDINASKPIKVDNAVRYRLHELDGFDHDNIELLVFDSSGSLISSSEYFYRNLFGSFHVFVRKYSSVDGTQQVVDYQPFTFVALDCSYKTTSRITFTIPASTVPQEYVIRSKNITHLIDTRYVFVYKKIYYGTNNDVIWEPIIDFTLNDNSGDGLRINFTKAYDEDTEFVVVNGSEFMSSLMSFEVKKDRHEVNILSQTGMSLNSNAIKFEEGDGIEIPLYLTKDNETFPVRPVLANEVMVWLYGSKLIPNVDYEIVTETLYEVTNPEDPNNPDDPDNPGSGNRKYYIFDVKEFPEIDSEDAYVEANLTSRQKIRIFQNFNLMPGKNEIRVLINRPYINRGSFYYYNEKLTTDNELKGIIDFGDRRANLGSMQSYWMFNDRRLVSLDQVTVIDEQAVHVTNLTSSNNIELMFDYVTNQQIERLLEIYLSSESSFSKVINFLSLEGDEDALRRKYYEKYINENAIGYQDFIGDETSVSFRYLQELVRIKTPVAKPVLLLESEEKGLMPFLDLVNDSETLIERIKVASKEITINHTIGHDQYKVVAQSTTVNYPSFIETVKTANEVVLKFNDAFKGLIFIFPSFMGDDYKFTKKITGLVTAEANSYVGTNEIGEFGVHPIPDRVIIYAPVVTKVNIDPSMGIDGTKDIVIDLRGFEVNSKLENDYSFTEVLVRSKVSKENMFVKNEYSATKIRLTSLDISNFISPSSTYEIYIRYLTGNDSASALSSPIEFSTRSILPVKIIPRITSPLDGQRAAVKGIVTVANDIDPEENKILFSRLQISETPDFNSIVFDNLEDRPTWLANPDRNKYSISYSGLKLSTPHFIRVSFEQKNTGYSNWSSVAPMITPDSIAGNVSIVRNLNVSYQDTRIAKKDNFVYIFEGKANGNLNAITKLNTLTGVSELLTNEVTPERRKNHSFLQVGNSVYIFGGFSLTREVPLNDFWRYNLVSEKWTRIIKPNTPIARYHARMSLDLANLRIYLSGGLTAKEDGITLDTLEYYDITSATWNTSPIVMPRALKGHVFEIAGGKILIAGGKDSVNHITGTTFKYDMNAVNPEWEVIFFTSEYALGFRTRSAVVNDRTVIAYGGEKVGDRYVDYILDFDTLGNSGWYKIPLKGDNLPGFQGHTISYENGELLILGGTDLESNPSVENTKLFKVV